MTDSRADVRIRSDYPEPLWLQAVELISGEIDSGALRPGTRLPPERELCQQLGMSRVTLRKALTHLVDHGVLRSSHGRGWYVASPHPTSSSGSPVAKDWPNSLESFSETAARMGLPATSRVLRADVLAATIDEGEELQVAPGTPLFHLDRVRLLGGVPIAVDRDTIPAALVPGHDSVDFATDSLYRLLTVSGVTPARADSTVEAKSASDDIAGHLDLEPGKPILVLTQLVVDVDERPVLRSIIQYSGDRYRLRTQFARPASRNHR
ncbi:GntR family transcriptional regulator [Microbacterium aoyamense]|uniref:GntR family transcriptional regulator n=1 Tax=Microbacterium aoyamense TaxID=344166 RepID=A0ABN2PZA8_9MICO|nr:GntR family transcriptional regulator [Microbacterium aoyamense]